MRTRNTLTLVAIAILIAVVLVAGRKSTSNERPGTAAITPAKGTFAGRVTDTRGQPIAARIEVVWIGERALPRTIASAVASENGTYSVSSKRPAGERGTMLLSAKAEGFAMAGRVAEIETPRQDFVLVREQTSATIKVVDKNDAPVSGAEVVLSFEPHTAERGALVVAHGTSDGAGELTVTTLSAAAGTFHWSATKKGRGAAHGEVEKRAGDAPSRIVARLDAGVSIAGEIVDVQGNPASGANVRAFEASGTWEDSTSAGADGRFTISGAPHGELALEVAGEWVLAGGRAEVTYVDVPVDMDEKTVKLVVEHGGSITGRVQKSDGSGVAGVDLTAMPVKGNASTPKSIATRADGTFELRGLRAGTEWDLTARNEAFAPTFAEHVRTGAKIDLVLRTGGALAGRVVDDGGNGAADIEIYAHRIQKSPPSGTTKRAGREIVGLREYAFVKTNADGTYRLEHLGDGTYHVEVRQTVRMVWSGPAAKTLEANVTEENTTRLADVVTTRPGQIKGRVTSGDGQLPRSVQISLLREKQGGTPHRVVAQIARDGSFVVPGIEPGVFTVDAHDPDRGHVTVHGIEVRAGGSGNASFVFDARNEIAGTIRDSAGKVVAEAVVDVYRNDERQAKSLVLGRSAENLTGNVARTDAQGRFVVRGLPSGRYRVRVSKEGAPPITSDIDVPAKELALVLPRASSLDVNVALADRVVIVETSDGAGFSAQGITNDHGVARFTALPPGSYRVRAVVDGAPEARIALAAGETKTTALHAPQGSKAPEGVPQ